MTYKVVQRAILLLWATGAAVTCLPFLNFGLFYNRGAGCLRYRDATLPKDIAYAYIFFTFGKHTNLDPDQELGSRSQSYNIHTISEFNKSTLLY